MGIDTERDMEANMQIGPTSLGMVRLFIEAQGVEIPMDFDPEEAEEIADEIRAAAQAARAMAPNGQAKAAAAKPGARPGARPPPKAGPRR